MTSFLIMLGIILWIALALWPAVIASKKGRSFFGFFLLSIPFFWITLILVYKMPDRTEKIETQ